MYQLYILSGIEANQRQIAVAEARLKCEDDLRNYSIYICTPGPECCGGTAGCNCEVKSVVDYKINEGACNEQSSSQAPVMYRTVMTSLQLRNIRIST